MLLNEVAKYLQDNSLGTVGTDIFKSFAPNSPNTTVVIYETQGLGPQHTFGSTATAWEHPRFQVVSRSTNYETARNKADDIYAVLINVANQTIKSSTAATGAFYLRIDAMQSPFSIGIDENERILIACNYDVMKSLST